MPHRLRWGCFTPQNPTLSPQNNLLHELYTGAGGRTTQQGYSSDSVRQKFTGYEHDAETGLEFAEARYYSSSGGRFTSPDPFSGSMELTDPQRDIQKMEMGLMFSSRRGDVVISFCVEVTIG